MPFTYPVEIVYRCFALYLDYLSYAEIARMEGNPGPETITSWAKEGMGTEGYPWDKIRDQVASRRAVASYEREVGERALRPWDEKVKDIAQDLEDAQDAIMLAIQDGSIEKPKYKDLTDIIKAKALIHGEATSRVESTARFVKVLAQITLRRVQQFVKERQIEKHTAERLLDLIAQDFEAARIVGSDEKALKKLTP